jgi:hypothetical protein
VRVIFKFYVFVASFFCRFLSSSGSSRIKNKPEKIFISIFDDRDELENF